MTNTCYMPGFLATVLYFSNPLSKTEFSPIVFFHERHVVKRDAIGRD